MLDNCSGTHCALLVEDEVLVQMLGVEYLEELGLQVEVAGTATEAINKARLRNGQFHVAVVDLGLPDRRGDMLVAELRALYPFLPIVIASGYGDAAMRAKFSGDRRIAFLRKPYVLDNIQQAISGLRNGQVLGTARE